MKLHAGSKNIKLPEVTMKVLEKSKEAVTKEGMMLSLSARGNEGESTDDCVVLVSRRKADRKLQEGGCGDLASVQEPENWE